MKRRSTLEVAGTATVVTGVAGFVLLAIVLVLRVAGVAFRQVTGFGPGGP
jgi:hypothetical protein